METETISEKNSFTVCQFWLMTQLKSCYTCVIKWHAIPFKTIGWFYNRKLLKIEDYYMIWYWHKCHKTLYTIPDSQLNNWKYLQAQNRMQLIKDKEWYLSFTILWYSFISSKGQLQILFRLYVHAILHWSVLVSLLLYWSLYVNLLPLKWFWDTTTAVWLAKTNSY